MPEHFHLLMSEPRTGNPSSVMQFFKQAVVHHLLSSPGPPSAKPAESGAPTQPPPKESHFWMKRYYDFNVWSQKKRIEKLDYMHFNPVKRGLVRHPGDWPWSSYRFYTYADTHMLKIDWKWPEV